MMRPGQIIVGVHTGEETHGAHEPIRLRDISVSLLGGENEKRQVLSIV